MARGYKTKSGRSITVSLQKYSGDELSRVGAALYREANQILSASQPLVPVDTGALRASGYVTEPAQIGDTITVTVGYGGVAAGVDQGVIIAAAIYQGGFAIPDAPKSQEIRDPAGYALYVHENLEAHHPVGQALYLSTPFNAARAGMGERIAAFVKTAPRA